MKGWGVTAIIMMAVIETGCAPLWMGAGAAGTAGAYEAHSKYELDKLNRDYESGKMSQQEYEARKKQVQEGSVIY